MPRGATVGDVDWSVYGPCDTCGCVAGWQCHRGSRALKNPHPGRPKTGHAAFSPIAAEAGGSGFTEPADDPWGAAPAYDGPPLGPITPPAQCCDTWHPAGTSCPDPYLPPDSSTPLATEPRADGCVCPVPMRCEECLHDLDCPQAEDPRPWCECEHGEQCRPGTPCRQRSHDPIRCPQTAGWSVDNGDTDTGAYGVGDTTKDETMAMDPPAEAADWTARLDNAERLPSNPTGKRRSDAEVPKDVDRDQYDRPKLVRAQRQPDGSWRVPFYPPGPEPHAGTPIVELEGYTRASTLGNALEDSTGLGRWRIGMVVFGMSRRKDLVLAAQAVPGTEDKRLHRRPLYEIGDKALEAAEASSAATVGSALHALTEQVDQGTLAVDIGEYQPVLDAYLERMTGWRVVRSETFVVSDYFHAAGTFDRLITPTEPMALVDQHTGEIVTVIMPGDLVVVDLKTSTTADYFGAKFFAQLAVYVTGALYDRDPESPTFGARTPLGQRTDFALILHIPQGGDADGEPAADWHWLDMRAGLALAQLACVVLETRKKRFTRTHMRPVLARPISADQAAADIRTGGASGRRALGGLESVPSILPNRDPLGDRHLAGASEFIAEAESFPEREADIVDAELEEDGAMPEQRFPAPAALDGVNAGGPDTSEYRARIAAETPRSTISTEHLEEEDGAMPGPEETAPLPAGWESKEEQELARESTTEVPKGLGGKLQDAAARHAVEDKLIRKIQAATSVRGSDGLADLYQRASAKGYWSDRVKAAASTRRAELERRAAG
jgi:hypothetical protein